MPTTIDEVWLTCKCRQFRDMIRTALSLHLFKHLLWADWLIPYSLLNLSWWIELQKLNHQYIELNVLQCILKTILNNSNWVCETEMPTNSQITFKTIVGPLFLLLLDETTQTKHYVLLLTSMCDLELWPTDPDFTCDTSSHGDFLCQIIEKPIKLQAQMQNNR